MIGGLLQITCLNVTSDAGGRSSGEDTQGIKASSIRSAGGSRGCAS